MRHASSSKQINSSIDLYRSDLLSVVLIAGLVVVGGVFYVNSNKQSNPFMVNDVFAKNSEDDVSEEVEPTETPEIEDSNDDYNEDSEVVTNTDGSTTTVTTKTEDNGNVKITTSTIDAAGNETKEVIETKDNGEQEVSIESKFTDSTQFEYKQEDGGIIKLEIQQKTEGVKSKVEFDSENNEFEVEVNDNATNTLKVKFNDNMFKLTRSGVEAATNFPIVIDEETGVVSVTTSKGNVVLKQMPDTIVNKASIDNSLDSIEGIDLEEDEKNKLTYVVKGNKSEKLLGLIAVEIPTILNYDPTSGSLLEITQTFVSKILDLFSF